MKGIAFNQAAPSYLFNENLNMRTFFFLTPGHLQHNLGSLYHIKTKMLVGQDLQAFALTNVTLQLALARSLLVHIKDMSTGPIFKCSNYIYSIICHGT